MEIKEIVNGEERITRLIKNTLVIAKKIINEEIPIRVIKLTDTKDTNIDIRRKVLNARGLFKSKESNTYIHSDINGAWNIGRTLLPELFNKEILYKLGKMIFKNFNSFKNYHSKKKMIKISL